MSNKKIIVSKKKNPFLENLKFFGGSLFSNQVCVEGRKKPWYLALFAFLLAIVLALIPQGIQISQQKGADFLSATTYDVDLGIESFTNDLEINDINLVTQVNGDINVLGFATAEDSARWNTLTLATNGHYEFSKYVNTDEGMVAQPKFKVFLAFGETDNVSNAYLLLHDEVTGISSSISKPAEGEQDNGFVEPVSYAIFGDKEMFFVIYAPEQTSPKNYTAYYSGDYSFIPSEAGNNTNLKNLMRVDFFDPTSEKADTVYDSAWITFLNNGYVNVRNLLFLTTLSIMGTIFIFVNVVFGLSVFLMTRGKNNPNRHISFGESYAIGAFAAPAPALLALIIGLIFPAMNSISYLGLYGLRIMWMSMRTLRPMPQ